MTPSEFIELTNGKCFDVDNAYGCQCVDLFKYMTKITIGKVWATPNGWADGYWYNRLAYEPYFSAIPNGQFQMGDWVVWARGCRSHPSSHIAMYVTGGFEYGTNQSATREACLKKTDFSDALGALRWRGWGSGMVIGIGYQEKTVNNVTAVIYRGSKAKGYTLHMIPAGDSYNSVADIKSITSDKLDILAKMNCNYFQMNADDYGCHYGVEQDSTVNGYHQEPKAKGIKVMWLDHDGNVGVCDQSDYWLKVSEVQMACAPYAMRKHNGDDTVLWSSALGDKDDAFNTQSAAIKFANGDWALAAFTTKIHPRDVVTYFDAFDEVIIEIALFDSGGSTQLVYMSSGELKAPVYTGRKIPNVLAIAREKGYEETDVQETPTDDETAQENDNIDYKKKYEEVIEKLREIINE